MHMMISWKCNYLVQFCYFIKCLKNYSNLLKTILRPLLQKPLGIVFPVVLEKNKTKQKPPEGMDSQELVLTIPLTSLVLPQSF